MMALLARGLTAIGGSWLTTPALILALVVSAYHWRENREARLRAEGRQQCDISWHLALQRQRTAAAEQAAARAQQIFEAERQTTEQLRHELQGIRTEFAAAKAAASADPSCLSPGVLDLLKRGAAVGGGR